MLRSLEQPERAISKTRTFTCGTVLHQKKHLKHASTFRDTECPLPTSSKAPHIGQVLLVPHGVHLYNDSDKRGSGVFIRWQPNCKLSFLHERHYFDVYSFYLHPRWSTLKALRSPVCMTHATLPCTFNKKYFVQYTWSVWTSNFYLNHLPFHQPAVTLCLQILYSRLRCSSSSVLPKKALAE